ncbi:hypothetical protein ACQJBY_038130 [Aegilops geniculata]
MVLLALKTAEAAGSGFVRFDRRFGPVFYTRQCGRALAVAMAGCGSSKRFLPSSGLRQLTVADGEDEIGKPHKLRLFSIASRDFGDAKMVWLCVTRLVYTNDVGEVNLIFQVRQTLLQSNPVF